MEDPGGNGVVTDMRDQLETPAPTEPPAPAEAPTKTKGKRGRPANKDPKPAPGPQAKKAKAGKRLTPKSGPQPKRGKETKGKPGPRAKPGPKPKTAKGDKGSEQKIDEAFKKVKRKVDRFKGMTEAEVMTRTLPDILTQNLDFVISETNVREKQNGLWLSQLKAKQCKCKELREGGKILVEKLKEYKPLIAVFNGKCIYEMFSREIFGFKPKKLEFGVQPQKVPDTETVCYLMPSSSARCAQFPRAQDKVHFYIKLLELRDQLKGVAKNKEVEEIKYTFDLGMAKEDAKRIAVKEEQYDPGYEEAYGGAYCEAGPGPELINGGCNLSAGETGGPSVVATPRAVEGRALDGDWMEQSFADQIPNISSCSTQPQMGAETA